MDRILSGLVGTQCFSNDTFKESEEELLILAWLEKVLKNVVEIM